MAGEMSTSSSFRWGIPLCDWLRAYLWTIRDGVIGLISLSPSFWDFIRLVVAHGQQIGSPLSCGDVLVHVLVLLKAALNGRSSKLIPDKGSFGYGFSFDGPGRGGTHIPILPRVLVGWLRDYLWFNSSS